MKSISILDRTLLLITGLLAAYQITAGMEGVTLFALLSYTIAFGVLLVAGLLLIIMGFEVLNSPLVVIISTIIPLSLSTGLVAEYLPAWKTGYLAFAGVGFLIIIYTRLKTRGAKAVIPLAFIHSVAGLLIFLLPIFLSLRGVTPGGFAWVGIGGALIGLGGILLTFLKIGKPILPQKTILTVLPGLLLAMTAAFIAGFALR